MTMPLIGTAGWSIPRAIADQFPTEGTGLERYATRFKAAEINSSFHRPHRASTWQRWRDSVPDEFRFSVKLPKTVTHVRKLVDCDAEVGEFLDQAHLLGDKLAVLLVQLPPKLEFNAEAFAKFIALLRPRTSSKIACEPRNISWFGSEADTVLRDLLVARVAADPAITAEGARPGGWRGLDYWRLHGSPVIYRSSYAERIDQIASDLRAEPTEFRWCIFDNTASSAGADDALRLIKALRKT
jgi:uncharacterized protein YecE (DUF72 family)